MRSGESLWSLYSVPSYLKGGSFLASLVFQFFHANFFSKKKSLIYRALNGFGKWKVRLLPFVDRESREYDSYILWFFNCLSSAQNKKIFKKLSNIAGGGDLKTPLFIYFHMIFFFLYKYSLFWDKTNQYSPRVFLALNK